MSTTEFKPFDDTPKNGVLTNLVAKLLKKASNFFEPEEIEITFKEDQGKIVSYTYTKLPTKGL